MVGVCSVTFSIPSRSVLGMAYMNTCVCGCVVRRQRLTWNAGTSWCWMFCFHTFKLVNCSMGQVILLQIHFFYKSINQNKTCILVQIAMNENNKGPGNWTCCGFHTIALWSALICLYCMNAKDNYGEPSKIWEGFASSFHNFSYFILLMFPELMVKTIFHKQNPL